MGIDDFFDDIGKVVHKINKWTSINPPGLETKPILEISGKGVQFNTPSTFQARRGPGAVAVGGAPSVEAALSGYNWLVDNAISQPIATAALVGKMKRGKNDFFGGDYFSTEAWSKAWAAAEHISPGQAVLLNPEEASAAMASGLQYYRPPEAYLPPGFSKLTNAQQQEVLREAGMPAVGNQFIEKMRGNSAWFKYGSGAIDFAKIMFLDPVVITGRTAAATTRAVRGTEIAAPKGGLFSKAGWSAKDIDEIMASSPMQKLKDGIWANKDNPQLLYNTTLAQKSGMGPAKFASIASRLQSPDELNLFIRTGMGDKRAMDELAVRNAEIAMRMSTMDSRLDRLGLMRDRYSQFPASQRLIDAEIERAEGQLQADATLYGRYQELYGAQSQLDKLYMSAQTFEVAAERTAAQNAYRIGPARGRGARTPVTIQPGRGPITSARYTPTPLQSGIAYHRFWGNGDYFTTPVTMVRMLKNAKPRGYIDLHSIDKSSVAELRGFLARIPGVKEETRASIMDKYLKTTNEVERLDLIKEVSALGFGQVAKKYNVPLDVAQELYKTRMAKVLGTVEDIKRYTAATDPERVNAGGQPMHLDELRLDGGGVTLSPFTATRLVNGHVLQDLDQLGNALARHGDKLVKLREATGSAKDAVTGWAEYGDYLWKFATLFRLGYIARVLGDDLASQWAALGSAAMFLRASRGIRNVFENGARYVARPALQAREAASRAGASYAESELKLLHPEISRMETRMAMDTAVRQRELARAERLHAAAQARLDAFEPSDVTAKARAARAFAKQRRGQLIQARQRAESGTTPGRVQRLKDLQGRRDLLAGYHELSLKAADDFAAQQQKVIQGNQPFTIDGTTFPAAYGGKEGEYMVALTSADESIGNLLNTNKQMLQGSLERSFDHGAQPISSMQDEVAHLNAWAHAINRQIMQDPLSRMAVEGKSVEEMTKWLQRNPVGIAYRRRMPKMVITSEFARSAKYEVDQYLPTAEIRMKAGEEGGVSADFLRKAIPDRVERPDVHLGRIGTSQLAHARALDRIIQGWYSWAVTLPANRMSRHPLFNQLYEGQLKRMVSSSKKQGRGNFTVEETEEMAHSARQLALRDMRELVFDIAHKSDAASAMRFTSPFFSATAESFQRWGRVIANRPQVAGYAAMWYNAPLSAGIMQDSEGNEVDHSGYAYVPVYPLKPDGTPDYNAKPTVRKKMVPKGDRYIVTRVPKWFADSPVGKALNVEVNGKLMLSQNSMNMVTQGDPWFNPGFGPIVSIPVNEWVKDKPRPAEIARHLGVLPFGPQGGTIFGENPLGRAISMATPAHVRNFITGWDTSDDRYQRIKLQILQKEIFEFDQKAGRQPTTAEIAKMQERVADKTRSYWMWTAASSFLQPMATQRRDPYQFFRDQYNALRRQNALTADDEYLARFGESHFIFAQEASQSFGIPPTNKAVELTKKYRAEIAANPELAPLIVGPEGNGPFSREAYAYQLNTPIVPGGAEMQRTKMTADQALAENQRRLGWAKYTARMNQLNAKLRAAGFESFEDEGAEDFKAEKKAWTSLYAEPLMPDGAVNPYYNAEWSKDFLTQDERKYERLIPALTTLAHSDLAKQPHRTDLRILQEYLGGRKALVGMLNDLRLAEQEHTLAAAANADLRAQWVYFVDSLIEKDTRFGDLYHRYLSRDMGVDVEEEAE